MIALGFLGVVIAQAAPFPVEGDMQLLRDAAAARRANLELVPHGRLKWTFTHDRPGRKTQESSQARGQESTKANGVLRWLGEQALAEVTYASHVKGVVVRGAPPGAPQDESTLNRTVRLLWDGNQIHHYDVTVSLMWLYKADRGVQHLSREFGLDLRPSVAWNSALHWGSNSRHDTIQDPARMNKGQRQRTARWVVRREPPNRVVLQQVLRIDDAPAGEHSLTHVMDMDLAGSVVEFRNAGVLETATARYDFRRDSKGRVALHGFAHDQTSDRTGTYRSRIDVTEFDADHKPAAAEVSRDGLRLADDVVIEDEINRKRYPFNQAWQNQVLRRAFEEHRRKTPPDARRP